MTVTIAREALAGAVEWMRERAPEEGVGVLAGRATFPGQPCPRDTDGDGSCGQRHCPTCGDPQTRRIHPRNKAGAWCPLDDVHLDVWLPLANVSEFPRLRYEVRGADMIRAHEALEPSGRYPFVIVHSHISVGTQPSEADVEYARNPNQLHMILSLAGLHVVLQLWRLDPDADGPARVVRKRWRVIGQDEQATQPTDLTHGVTEA